MKFAGFVSVINTKSGRNKRGQWTAYSFKVEDPSGVEVPNWFSFGFDEPPFQEGDYITFEAEQKDGFWNYVPGTGDMPKNPPARASQRTSADSRSHEQQSKNAETPPMDAAVDRQTQIVMQHSQEMAIAIVDMLLRNDALPVSSAKTKAGNAKRYAEIMAAVDKQTVLMYNDVVTARILDVVADAGEARVSTEADGPIPDLTYGDDNDGDKESTSEESDRGESTNSRRRPF